MACYSPVTGYLARTPNKNGKRPVVFNRSAGFVDKPLTVPCGQCIGCRIDKSRMWAIRCVHESKLHTSNSFVTLTYDDDKLPLHGSLQKKDLQDFFKRARHIYGNFRYYASGEYGDNTQRPHYHIMFFGIDFSEDRKLYKHNQRSDILYKSDSLNKCWGLGFCTIGSFNYATAAYTARYAIKKVSGKLADEHYSRVDPRTGEFLSVEHEFAIMSRRPGIGSGWYDKFKSDAFPSDFLIYQGKKHSVPRFYTDKLKKEDLSTHKEIKYTRKANQEKNKANSTPDRLAVREECKKSQIKSLKRSI
ncbi:MAG: replication initiator protein [Microviridae sp.]|nr:MAG: replication initiator protein [Microviridae sp.]